MLLLAHVFSPVSRPSILFKWQILKVVSCKNMYHQSYEENLLGDGKTNSVPNTLPLPTLPNHLLFYCPANNSILPQYLQGGRWQQIKKPGSSLTKVSQHVLPAWGIQGKRRGKAGYALRRTKQLFSCMKYIKFQSRWSRCWKISARPTLDL